MKLIELIVLMTLWTCTNSITFHCIFEMVSFRMIGETYTCWKIKVDIPDESRRLTAVTGDHAVGQTNYKVFGLSVAANCTFIPTGIENFFPNLEMMRFDTDLKTITDYDLLPFHRLKGFYVFNSSLEVIPDDIFTNNIDLVFLRISETKLKHVGANFITHLKKLLIVEFYANTCISMSSASTSQLESLKYYLAIRCPPLENVTEVTTLPTILPTTILPTTVLPTCELIDQFSTCDLELRQVIYPQIAEQINPLKIKIFDMDHQLNLKDAQINDLKNQLIATTEQFERRNSELEHSVNNTKEELNEARKQIEDILRLLENQ